MEALALELGSGNVEKRRELLCSNSSPVVANMYREDGLL
jgi:hypothetical protein